MVTRHTRHIIFHTKEIDTGSLPDYVDAKTMIQLDRKEKEKLDLLVSELISFLKKNAIEYTYSNYITNQGE